MSCSGRRNCVSGQATGYPSAPSRVRKDPRVERKTTAAFDTDSWSRHEAMRGYKGETIPEQDIFLNPKQEVRKYPVHLFVDSIRKNSDISAFINKGRMQFNLNDSADKGITCSQQVRNIIHLRMADKIRIPYVNDPTLYLYDRFAMDIDELGSKFGETDIAGACSSTPFHFWFDYEFDDVITPQYIILTPQDKCLDLVTQGTNPNSLTFTLRTPFIPYPFPVDRAIGTITVAVPLTIVLNNDLTHNLTTGDYVAFVAPNTTSDSLNKILSTRAGIPTSAAVSGTNTFQIAEDGTGAVGSTVEVIFIKNRVLFTLSLEGLRA
ncbi:hypothetical protein KDA11_05960 [Candidatus Saccharibacteria bacterium]|nr:hypothetical protein [Candidatus Saccharibacteria bacterium]